MNASRHVADDTPGIVEDFRNTTSVEINIAPHLGASEMMLDLLASVAAQ